MKPSKGSQAEEQLACGQTKGELQVGEMEGVTFKVEPLKRKGEDNSTKRARLLCECCIGYIFHLKD